MVGTITRGLVAFSSGLMKALALSSAASLMLLGSASAFTVTGDNRLPSPVVANSNRYIGVYCRYQYVSNINGVSVEDVWQSDDPIIRGQVAYLNDENYFYIFSSEERLTPGTSITFTNTQNVSGNAAASITLTLEEADFADGDAAFQQNCGLNSAPTITSPTSYTIDENTTFVADIDANDDVDSEGSGLTYSLTGGDDQALFQIDPDTGELSFKAAPDFDNPQDTGADNIYEVEVTVADGDDGEDSELVSVTVGHTAVETVALIGAMQELRSRLILQHGPNAQRRLNRLKGIYANNGGVSGFGLAYRNDNLPVALTVGKDSGSFAYSLRNYRAEGRKQGLSGNVGSVATGLLGAPEANGHVSGNTQALAYSGSLSAAEKQSLGMDGSLTPASAFAPSGSKRDSAAGGIAPLAMFGDGDADADGGVDPMSQRYDIWAEGQYSRFNATAGDGTFAILHAGADYLVTRDLLVGLGTQFDWIDMDASSGTGTADGWGFMIGPYMTAKLADGLYLDARGAFGQSYNHVSPAGTYEDAFDGERWLATAALIGEFEAGAFTVSPEARLSWFREQSEAYVDSLLTPVPSVTTETGTFSFGPTISRKIAMENGAVVTPFTTVTGIWTFDQTNTATAVSSQPGLAEEGIRAKVEAGFDVANDNGLSLSISGHYDGIGEKGFEAYGGKLGVSQAF